MTGKHRPRQVRSANYSTRFPDNLISKSLRKYHEYRALYLRQMAALHSNECFKSFREVLKTSMSSGLRLATSSSSESNQSTRT